MATEKVSQLIRKLLQQTREARVKWEKTASPGVFLAAFPDYTIRIRREVNVTREMPEMFPLSVVSVGMRGKEVKEISFVMAILNADGDVIDEVNDKELEEVKSVYEHARRQALGADKAVDELLAALESGNT